MSRFSAVAKQFPSPSKSCAFVFDSPAPQAHNGGMNENNDADKSGEQPEGGNRPGQPLTRSEKIISTGLIAVAAVLWGVYGPGLMKDSWVEKRLDSSLGVAVLFIVCIAVSCTILYACKEEDRAKDGKGKGIAAGNAPEGGRASRGEPNDKGSSPRIWTKWHPAAIPWFIALSTLFAMDFKWQSLLSGLWVLIVLLFIYWPFLAKTEAEQHSAKRDLLGRGLMYNCFGDKIRILVEDKEKEKKGLSIVVTGEWGSGKSHFINAIVSSLEHAYEDNHKLYREPLGNNAYKGKFVVANVDLWQSATVKAMWQDIAHAMLYMLNGYEPEMNLFKKFIFGLMSLLPFGITSEVKDAMKLISTGGDPYTLSNKLCKRFLKSSLRYILVMDNVDRCSEKIQRNVFSLIERLNNVPHLVIICGIAKGEMATAIRARSRGIRSALLKVFDIQVPMPLLMREQAKDYLNELLDITEKKIECPNLVKWCKKQDFTYVTPRMLERLVAKLSLLDNMYLMRVDDETLFFEDWDGYSLSCSIFNFEALRLVCPEMKFPYQSATKENNNSKSYDDWRKYINDVFCMTGKIDKSCDVYGMRDIARQISEAPEKHIDYIAGQKYLRIYFLSMEKCKKILDEYEEGCSPPKAIEKTYGGAYASRDESALTKRLCRYSVFHAEHQSSLPFMESFCKSSIGEDAFPLFLVTNMAALLCSSVLSDSKVERWKVCLKEIVSKYLMPSLKIEVEQMLDYIWKNQREQEEFRFDNKDYFSKKLNAILEKLNEDSSASGDFCGVLKLILQEYAKKACAFILDSNLLDDDGQYKHLSIGQSIPRWYYVMSLKEGVQDFINSDVFVQYKLNTGKCMERLLRSIIIRSHDSETLELTDMPFDVLSFAVIWSNLICGLLGQRKLSTDELTIVEERLATISTMSKEKKDAKGSEQFRRNRETAMRILRTTLERLKKGAGND